MSALFLSLPLLWAQAQPRAPRRPRLADSRPRRSSSLMWLVLWSDPTAHVRRSGRRASDLAEGDQSRLPGMLGRLPGW